MDGHCLPLATVLLCFLPLLPRALGFSFCTPVLPCFHSHPATLGLLSVLFQVRSLTSHSFADLLLSIVCSKQDKSRPPPPQTRRGQLMVLPSPRVLENTSTKPGNGSLSSLLTTHTLFLLRGLHYSRQLNKAAREAPLDKRGGIDGLLKLTRQPWLQPSRLPTVWFCGHAKLKCVLNDILLKLVYLYSST